MVKIYTKTVCPKCIVAKGLFEGNEVEYEPVNIDHDAESKQKLIDLGFMGVPIVEHNGKFYKDMGEFQRLIDNLK